MERSRAQRADTPREPDAEVFSTAGHEALFAEELTVSCDACGRPMPEDDGFAITGEGEYVWTRGDEVRREKAPLCPTCASAIFGAAIAMWDIEDDEG